jgi:hypothetical protein
MPYLTAQAGKFAIVQAKSFTFAALCKAMPDCKRIEEVHRFVFV